MNRMQRFFTALILLLGMLALVDAGIAAGKANHHDGQQLLGEKVKSNGHHVIHQKGEYTASVDVQNGKVAGIAHVSDDDQLLLITEQGMIIRTNVADLRSMGRSTQGVRVINVEENDRVVAAVKLVEKEEPANESDENTVH